MYVPIENPLMRLGPNLDRSTLAKLSVLVLFLATIGTGAVVATGVTPVALGSSPLGTFTQSDGVDVLDPDANFVVEPIGPFAYLVDDDGEPTDGDGELVIDLSEANPRLDDVQGEGVNSNSLTVVPVFELTYTGNTSDRPANVSVHLPDNSGGDVLTFRDGGTGQSITGEQNNVTLQPNESVRVDLVIDSAAADPDLLPGIIFDDQIEIRAIEVVEDDE